MSLFHLEMDDSSLFGQFPGNFGGGAPANIGVHNLIQITPTWDVYNGWFIPRGNVGLGLGPQSFKDLFDNSAFSWCWTFSWSWTIHSNSNWE